MTVVDHSTFVAMGARMQAMTGYTAEQSSDLYITDGDWNDWMYSAQHKSQIADCPTKIVGVACAISGPSSTR